MVASDCRARIDIEFNINFLGKRLLGDSFSGNLKTTSLGHSKQSMPRFNQRCQSQSLLTIDRSATIGSSNFAFCLCQLLAKEQGHHGIGGLCNTLYLVYVWYKEAEGMIFEKTQQCKKQTHSVVDFADQTYEDAICPPYQVLVTLTFSRILRSRQYQLRAGHQLWTTVAND